jgi:HD superfamily phosphohydrolase
MIVGDSLYGDIEIEEVLEKLILSDEIQRLKDVHMAGPAFLLNPLWNETRYEHSIGVMLLIRKLGGSLEEQIAGLLHDVSHTAFSHVIDLALENEADDYHERIKSELLTQSTIPELLLTYGYDYEELLVDDTKWTLLEQSAPLLCCDRIDYTLREVQRYFDVPVSEIKQFLQDIKIVEGKIVLRTTKWALWFIDQYRKVVIDFFYDPKNICSYEWMADIIRLALADHLISLADLMVTDSAFMQTIRAIASPNIQQLIQKLEAPVSCLRCTEEDSYDIYQKKKTRVVDPLIVRDGKLIAVSLVSDEAKEKIEQLRSDSEKGIYLKIT